jgi:transcription-repair coupling factor (superfamily II helicase)
LEHGVGIYRGIETIFVGQSTIEVAVVEYEGGDRLNVPLYRIDQLERYRSADDVSEDAPPPRMQHLRGRRWAHQREKAGAALPEMTVELLTLRAAQDRDASGARPDTPWQRQLESASLEDTLTNARRPCR